MKVRIIKTDEDQLSILEKKSALVWVGIEASFENVLDIADFLDDCVGIKDPLDIKVYTWTGDIFNKKYNLTGSNAYNENTPFLAFSLDTLRSIPSDTLAEIEEDDRVRLLDEIIQDKLSNKKYN